MVHEHDLDEGRSIRDRGIREREASALKCALEIGHPPLPGRLSSVKRYDPVLNAWETVAPMGTGRIGSIALV